MANVGRRLRSRFTEQVYDGAFFDLRARVRLSARLSLDMTPFGGYKRSGLGRENGQQAIMAYLQQKSVWIATETSAANPFIMK